MPQTGSIIGRIVRIKTWSPRSLTVTVADDTGDYDPQGRMITNFLDVKCFGNLAEHVLRLQGNGYLPQGRDVHFSAHVERHPVERQVEISATKQKALARFWETDVVAERITLLGAKPRGSGHGDREEPRDEPQGLADRAEEAHAEVTTEPLEQPVETEQPAAGTAQEPRGGAAPDPDDFGDVDYAMEGVAPVLAGVAPTPEPEEDPFAPAW